MTSSKKSGIVTAMEKIKLLTTEEAAKILGITRQGLAHLVKKGSVKPVDNIVSKYKFFTEDSLYEYLRKR